MRPSSFAFLRLLESGRPVRAGASGFDSAAAAQAASDLAACGLEVRRAGDAWQLAAPFDALDAAALAATLAGTRVRAEVIDECDSTNRLVADRAEAGAVSGTALACELQTAGRGRRGADWYAALGASLTFSVLWRFARGAASLGGLSLAVGVACARALESLGATRIALKWPNDLLVGGRKLGGILIEVQGGADTAAAAIVGIGINVRLPEAARRAIPQPVADLADAGVDASRTIVLGAILAALDATLAAFERDGFARFRDEWTSRHAWQGGAVRLLVPPERVVEGIATGVAEDGALLVDTGGSIERFHSAEVSLCRAA